MVAAAGALRLAGRAGVGRGGPLAGAGLRRRRLRAALHRDVPVRGRARRRPRRAEGAAARAGGGRRSRSPRSRSGSRRSPSSSSASPSSPRSSARRPRLDRGAVVVGGGAARPRARSRARCSSSTRRSPSTRSSASRSCSASSFSPAACAALALRGERGRVPRRRLRALGAGGRRRVRRPVADRRERDAPARDRAAARAPRRGARLVPAALARRPRGRRRARVHARPLRRRGASTATTPARRRQSFWEPALDSRPSGLEPRPPRRGRADRRPLGGVLGAARRLPARARLVPAARHRPEPALLRGAARARRPTAPGSTALGVRYVLLPDTQLGRIGEEREAELLRSGRAGPRSRSAAPAT